MAFQGRHQTWSGLHKINFGVLEGQGEEGGVCGLKGTDLQVQLPSLLPIMFPWLCRLRQCPHSASAGAIVQGQSIIPAPGEQFCRGCWHCPSSVSGGAAWGTRSHCTADKGKSDWRSQAVSSAPGSVAVLKEAGCTLCKHSFAVLMAKPQHRVEERCITLLSLQLCIEALHWGQRGGKEQQVPLGDRRGFRLYPFIVCQGECQAFSSWRIKPTVY